MHEFSAKKLGEVLAFAQTAVATLEKAHEAFQTAFGPEEVENILRENRIHAQKIVEIASAEEFIDVTEEKAERTGDKLAEMRDLYVKDQWDNPTELMEWSGFFEGAAIVHWRIIEGIGEEINSEEVMELAEDAIAFHTNLLEKAGSYLHEVGQAKA